MPPRASKADIATRERLTDRNATEKTKVHDGLRIVERQALSDVGAAIVTHDGIALMAKHTHQLVGAVARHRPFRIRLVIGTSSAACSIGNKPRRSGHTIVHPSTSSGATRCQVTCVRGCPCNSSSPAQSPRGAHAASPRQRLPAPTRTPRTLNGSPPTEEWETRAKLRASIAPECINSGQLERCERVPNVTPSDHGGTSEARPATQRRATRRGRSPRQPTYRGRPQLHARACRIPRR